MAGEQIRFCVSGYAVWQCEAKVQEGASLSVGFEQSRGQEACQQVAIWAAGAGPLCSGFGCSLSLRVAGSWWSLPRALDDAIRAGRSR